MTDMGSPRYDIQRISNLIERYCDHEYDVARIELGNMVLTGEEDN